MWTHFPAMSLEQVPHHWGNLETSLLLQPRPGAMVLGFQRQAQEEGSECPPGCGSRNQMSRWRSCNLGHSVLIHTEACLESH